MDSPSNASFSRRALDTWSKPCNRWKIRATSPADHRSPTCTRQSRLQPPSSIWTITAVCSNVVRSCTSSESSIASIATSLSRLLKSIVSRLSSSTSTPYAAFQKHSIELVHIAKVSSPSINESLSLPLLSGIRRNLRSACLVRRSSSSIGSSIVRLNF